MASGRRKQDDKTNFTLISVEVSLYISDVSVIFTAATELKRRDYGKAEDQRGHNTDFDVSSFSHIRLNSSSLRSSLAGTRRFRKNNRRNNHREAV